MLCALIVSLNSNIQCVSWFISGCNHPSKSCFIAKFCLDVCFTLLLCCREKKVPRILTFDQFCEDTDVSMEHSANPISFGTHLHLLRAGEKSGKSGGEAFLDWHKLKEYIFSKSWKFSFKIICMFVCSAVVFWGT